MTLFLSVSAILLLALGFWGGPVAGAARKRGAELPNPPADAREAWDILARPMAEPQPLMRMPEHRPWFFPSGDRRFQRGILVGLGAGLMVAALSVAAAPNNRAQEGPGTVTPAQPAPAAASQAPGGATAPAPGTAAKPATPGPAAAKPAPAAPATFTVDGGDLPHTVAARLREAGLIANEEAFLGRLTERGLDTLLKIGTFTIPGGASLDEVIDALTA